uniref:RRM domain-containing protein n=1 Tax=Ananas comosus var. bracteatus TaxID=296719 RepID=A0A6V7QB93_ANACO|nr:unnamed protein product [Ananas comosus var. bracteatus]
MDLQYPLGLVSSPSSSSSSYSSSCSFVSNSRNSIALFPDLPPASRIFVRNISYFTGEATLIKLFSRFGRIVEVKLAKHEDSKRSKGYAFIQYASQDDAISAMEQMDQKRIDGRTIYAEIAKPVNNGFADYPITSGPPSGEISNPIVLRIEHMRKMLITLVE